MLPGIEPIPPSTTMTNDLIAGNEPTSGEALMMGASSPPKRAASAPESVNTMLLARAVSMPASDAPRRFCATA